MSTFKLSSVLTSAIRTSTHGINAVGNLASACDALSSNAELNAWVSVAQSSVDLCKELGIKSDEGAELNGSEALVTAQNLLKQLRGY